ncbi:MAG: hypothetical protein BAJALOKI2v1_210001 [Promethearchaeota archaeon]|nr:MAG: hypothetical protein BAJALOKI2v1_210001 [Candidatus Lokiarchaeota archaeon]
MPENKVKKYFDLVEVWAWCDICEDMVNLKVDKSEINKGLKTGIYTKEHKHSNQYPDTEDLDDVSDQEHTIYVYIDENYDVAGVKSFFGDAPSMDDFEAAEPGGEVRIPVVVKELPATAVQLGMLTSEQFKLLKVCDGMSTVEEVADIVGKSVEEVDKMLNTLRDKNLVKVIKRA